ncbi:MAG: IS1182 family transposase [Pseudomonadota bacterium]
MGRFVEGEDRDQWALLPARLEDYAAEENPVRMVDAYGKALDLTALGFERAQPKATGRPGYHPSVLLKIYLYGYLNRIHSSRRLEREANRNVELMWLTGRLTPDFKTVADFRKDNGAAMQSTCAQFIELRRELGLFARAVAAIDGAKFKAVNAREKNFTKGKLKRRIGQVEAGIARYLQSLDVADMQEGDLAEAKAERLREKIATMKAKLSQLRQREVQVEQSPDHQVSLTDLDARAMATSMKTGMVGYNVHTAVDTDHHLIVTRAVTNIVSDKPQLSSMAAKAKAAMGRDELDVIADRGYFSGEEIVACEAEGITPYVPKTYTSGAKAAGRFGKDDFDYDPSQNAYRCPAGEMLTHRYTNVEAGRTLHAYWTTKCGGCHLKSKCTPAKERRVRRWEHEGVIDAMLQRLNDAPDSMNIRRRTVEHPFGTIKAWMGATHFLTKGLKNVQAEMSLRVLDYNLKRVIATMGMRSLIAAIQS